VATESLPELNTIIALIGGLVLLLGLFSRPLSCSSFPPVLLALVAGIAVGPAGLNLLDPARLARRSDIIEYAARVTLAIGLFGSALRIGPEYPRKSWRDVAVLVFLGMPMMWAVSTLLLHWVLGLPLLMALLVGAIITPTDPIAATPIVTGDLAEKHIPERVRNAISTESGANDGLAYPFVMFALLMLEKPSGEALQHWLTRTLLWEVLGATLIGLMMGYAGGKLLKFADERKSITGEWRLVYTVALALVTAGVGRIIATDEVLLVFAAGISYTQLLSEEEREEEDLGQEAVNRFFSIPIFMLLGMVIPWQGWVDLGWRGAVLAAAILALRRPPVLLLLRRGVRSVATMRETLFVGWFGPIAVAAIYYASIAERTLEDPVIWHIVSLVVCASVLAHSLTAAPFTRRLESNE
jgi:sodium/hydrogen antiporter